jgi:urease accessory protein
MKHLSHSSLCKSAITFIALLAWSAAQAHSDQVSTGGLMAGYLHPLTGLDHLLAMVAVGIWGATLGAPLIWMLPIAFPLMMVVGGVLAIVGIPLPYVELGVALSVLVLGVAIALRWRASLALAVSIVAAFGILHGYAHGSELPGAASPVAYAAGFVMSTGLLHLAGIAFGALEKHALGTRLVRVAGSAIALTGAWLVIG